MEIKVIMPEILDFNSIYLFTTLGQIIIPFVILFAIFIIIELTKKLLILFILMTILVLLVEQLAYPFYLLI